MASSRTAFVTGVCGQDGSYLAELLLDKGYTVHGLVRDLNNTARIAHLRSNQALILHCGDLMEFAVTEKILLKIKAEEPSVIEVYNLAAQSHVQVSFDSPLYTAQVDALGTLGLLDVVRKLGLPNVRFCQASTAEMFGLSPPPQSEDTPFYPRSPYAISKVFAYWTTRNYREVYKMFACNAICFNHESERRGDQFVTKKIVKAVARIAKGDTVPLELGNLEALKDWGYARDFVYAMWLMLQEDEADDYVIATGEQHSVREYVQVAFEEAGIAIYWEGDVARRVGSGQVLACSKAEYFRPVDVHLLGDASKLRARTGWKPSVSFRGLVRQMLKHEMS